MLGLGSALPAGGSLQSALNKLFGRLRGRSTYSENGSDSKQTVIDIQKVGTRTAAGSDVLTKATILLTPDSYSDGKMRSVKSGSTVTHSENFATNTTGLPWNTDDAGQLITHVSADNVLRITYNGTTGVGLKRGTTLLNEAGAQYRVTFKARGTRAAAFLSVGSLTDIDNSVDTNPILDTDFQEYEFFVRTDTSPQTLRMYQGTGSAEEYLEITDLLVQDTSSDFDFSRDSSAMRVGPDGLLQDMQDVVGESELILNGDFSDISSNILPNADFSINEPANQTYIDGGLQFDEWKEYAHSSGLKRYTSIDGGIRCTITNAYDDNWNQRIYQELGLTETTIVLGKSYHLKYEVRCSKAGGFRGAVQTTYGSAALNETNEPVLVAEEWTYVDEAFYCSEVSREHGEPPAQRPICLQFFPTVVLSPGDWYEVRNVSLQEYDPNDRWTGSPSGEWAFNENGVISSDSATLISQLDVLDEAAGVSNTDVFKATFTAKLISGDGGLDVYIGVNNANSVTTTATATEFVVYDNKAPSTGTSTTQFYFYNTGGGVIEISNVSVKNITLTDDLDIPRISYDKDGLNGHILLEPARTNQIKRSEDFRASPWGSTGSPTISAPSEAGTLAPDGTYTATKFTSDDATSAQFAYHSALTVEDVGSTSTTYYTTSVFAKKIDYDYMYLWFTAADDAFVGGGAWFNISNGTLGTLSSGVTASIEDFGNGWYRCSATKLPVDDYDSNGGQIRVALASSDNSQNVVGDGSKATYFWGTQFEEGAYPTSYIPTHTGASVTRSAETMTGSGNTSLINSTEGVLYAEIAALANDGTIRYMSLYKNDSTSNNRVVILNDASANRIRGIVSSGGTKYVDFAYDVTDVTDFHKVAVRYKANDFALWIDGVERQVDTSGSTPIGLDTLAFDLIGGSATYSKVKCTACFSGALTDDELEALTGDSYNNFGELATANGYTVQ
jgi:hypothetical protein